MDQGGADASSILGDRYELGALLGHGGMGSVRDATDRRLGRPVAVKILRPDLAADPRARRRFETEAHAAARLAHPNVVTVFDSGEDEGIPFLVMERLPGRTLADELKTGPLTLDRGRDVGHEVLSALAAAHAAGIIHRDIKPANVLLTGDGHVKVSDFGIAKTVDDIDQTQTTELVATPGYLAPERLSGAPASQRSDLYAVGVLLYESLSGRRPFEGDTPLGVMRAIERGQAKPLTSLRPALPAGVVAVVERAMSRDPAGRFGSADEMAAALEQAAVDLEPTVPIDAADLPDTVPVNPPSRDGETQAFDRTDPDTVERSPGRSTIGRRVLGAGVGALLATAVIAGIIESRDDNGASAGPSSATTTVSSPGASTGSTLPAALADAMRKLEQAASE